ncbi:hypothetical protein [Pedobacter heparinus]|uniref:NERD domain-containing protein n=1 Tax=Pedobacter heparinus (strain ATCC 13125 / DSM 2366 / CIP 104194 / JCM 7457 / NBRC 12017 / NCIMB 9290 / NRRL B-14731 / HIM 762-3) TaxID=485917 RepID=C6XVD6_PEDHD|nr:hypothetical protein [Pedobacter heparinus]ACU04002.1 hypothetical protein Phep_1793 [Pedobacter heparinus DSM 2366]
MENLESIAKELKAEIGQYDPDLFASRIVSIIHGLTHPWNQSVIKELVSPLRQLLYLLNLNLTSPVIKEYKEVFFEGSDWVHLVELLKKMEIIHQNEYGELKPFADDLFNDLSEDEVLRRRLIGVSTYNAFFHQGPLHFEEQLIEKISEIFKNFNSELKVNFGWDAVDFLSLYDCLDNLRQEKEDNAFMKKPQRKEPSVEEFKQNVSDALKNGKSFQEAMMEAAPFDTSIFEYQSNPSSVNIFYKGDLKDFSEVLSEALLANFTVRRTEMESFQFFSQPNQILKKPIYELNNGGYLIVDYRLLLSAIFSFLQQKCSEIIKKPNRLTSAKDKYLEKKVTEVFTDFYKKDQKAMIFSSYYLDGNERDLLVLSKDTALIIEAKAGNVREPMFDPDKAYDKIWSDFKETIDYGYEQAFSVKEKFLEKQVFDITDEKKKVLHSIDPGIYINIFSIIITYNKFGHAQNDLWLMLDLFDEDEEYPWSVCVDDLDIFLLAMKKMNFSLIDFNRFLKLRSQLHGNLVVNDEGRVMGHFLTNKRFQLNKGTYRFPASDDIIFDKLYSTGLGFKNERRLTMKQDPRIRKLY